MKKRILIANDASVLSSGYGVYGKEIISRLHKSEKFEVAELGCYVDVRNPSISSIPWRFYANAVGSDDPRAAKYKENPVNQFGMWRFNRVLLDFKPHIVFDVRDYWMYSYQEISPFRKFFHWVLMPTVDSAPQKTEWLYTFANADVIVPYTEWSKSILEKSCGNSINLFPKIANAGINTNEFYLIENKQQHKINHLGGDYNVVGLVMRNQKRKLFPDILLAFRKYLNYLKESKQNELYQKTFLYLHTSYPEENGWDIPNLLLEHNLLDKVFFTYVCKHCKKYFASKFHGSLQRCKYCGNETAVFSSVANGVEPEQLNEIFNLFDLYIQYAICEGFGMPQVEAAACGLKVASVDYSAMSEIVRSINGEPIPVDRVFRELETNADRVYPDIDATVNIMKNYFARSKESRQEEQETIRKKCVQKYTWDNVYSVWEECFDSVDIKNKPDWDTPEVFDTDHENMIVPPSLNPKQFVKYICDNVIKEPYLFYTAPIQKIVKDLTTKIISVGGIIRSFSHQDAISSLEQHLNNKIISEKLRTQPQLLSPEDYL
jgi:glycosyltransferase involved in cell wall biosynthesis